MLLKDMVLGKTYRNKEDTIAGRFIDIESKINGYVITLSDEDTSYRLFYSKGNIELFECDYKIPLRVNIKTKTRAYFNTLCALDEIEKL